MLSPISELRFAQEGIPQVLCGGGRNGKPERVELGQTHTGGQHGGCGGQRLREVTRAMFLDDFEVLNLVAF